MNRHVTVGVVVIVGWENGVVLEVWDRNGIMLGVVVVVVVVRRKEGEDCGGDGDSDEGEKEALLAEEIVDGAGEGEPGLEGFWGVVVVDGLGFVASED